MAKEIAYQWASSKLLPEIKILFLFYLRDPQLQSVSKIEQLVQYASNECLSSEQITTFTTYLANTRGQHLCIVMDGFDEYPPSLQKNSFILNIVNRIVLSEAIVVITSRPTATVLLHDRVDRKIDILGLPMEEQENYISKIFTNSPEKKVKLNMYLKQQPVINGLCSVPLHLSILLYLFQQGNLPKTLTEMNESFIIHTIYRHLERQEIIPSGPIDKLANVPKPVLDIVYNLSKLAFKGLQENKIVFTFKEVEQTCPYINKMKGAINGFGLLQAVEHYPHKGAGTSKSFNFLHYTMQEFLAALHVSTLPSEQQSSLMENSFWDIYCNFMWTMFVGIVGANSHIFRNFLSKQVVSKRKSQVSIADYIQNDKRKCLQVFQCFIEADSNATVPKAISDMFSNGIICLDGDKLFPYHIVSLTTFIVNSSIQYRILDLRWCMLTDIEMKEIQRCVCVSDKLSTLKHVNLSCNEASPWGVYCAIIRHCSITYLTLCGDRDYGIQDYAAEIIESLQKNTKLKSVTLGDASATTKAISSEVQTNKTLENLNISSSKKICDNGADANSDGLKGIDSLQELYMEYGGITSKGAKKIAEAIKVNTTIKILNIHGNEISDNGAAAISDSLKSNNSLQELNIGNNKITSERAIKIAEAIQVNTTLEELDLSFNKLCDDGASIISYGLNTNKSLQKLNMSKNEITIEGAKMIAIALLMNTTLIQLDLSSNKIFDDGATAISYVLKGNITLQELNISHNNITNKGITKITEAIQINSTLQNINISKNLITTEGLLYFMEAVKNNCTLQVVNITHNNVTRSGFTSIKQCIENLQCPIQICASWNEIKSTDELISKIFTSCAPDNIEEDVWSFNEYDPDHLVMCLSECLKEDDTLQELFLMSKGITSEGAKLIAEAIKVNKTLKKITLHSNSISDDGAAAISDSLKSNISLQELNMYHNMITGVGTKKIAEAIKVNKTLKILNIGGNMISYDGVVAISDTLKSNSSLQELGIRNNKITSEGAKKIAEVIKVNTTLKILNIDMNAISDDGVVAISNSLKSNNSLQELEMMNTNITSEGAKKIAEAIKLNTTLHTLDIRQYPISDALSFNMTVLTAVYHSNTLMTLWLPPVYDDDRRLVGSEVRKINNERTRRGISTLTCSYWL